MKFADRIRVIAASERPMRRIAAIALRALGFRLFLIKVGVWSPLRSYEAAGQRMGNLIAARSPDLLGKMGWSVLNRSG